MPNVASVHRALVAVAQALRPNGAVAIDLCDLEYGAARREAPSVGRVGDDWAIVTEFSFSSPDRCVRQMAVFVRNQDGTWRRDDERHENVLIDTALVPALLADHGVDARIGSSFGSEQLPTGVRTVIGQRVR